MNPMKRLGLTALVLIVAVNFAASHALAGKKGDVVSTTFKLAPPADAPEPRASGECTMDYIRPYWQRATVNCRGLTPDRQYTLVVLVHWSEWYEWWPISSGFYVEELTVTADAKGRLEAQCVVEGWSDAWGRYCYLRSIEDVWVENEAGSVVLEKR